jgi:hypothetical protein
MKNLPVTLTVALLALSACGAPKVWNKAGATQQDFATDSYACEKDSRQSGYYGGGLVGAINMQEFNNRSMIAHGWYLSSQTGTAQPNPKVAQIKSATEELKACYRSARAGSNYAPLLPHLIDLETGQWTMTQLADGHMPTQQERNLFVRYFDESQACRDTYVATASQLIPAAGPVLMQQKIDLQATALQLIRGQLTWGLAAQQQRDNQVSAKTKLQAIRA